MKLLYCEKCEDIYRPAFQYSPCKCGLTGGFYATKEVLIYSGKYAHPFAIDNDTFFSALTHRPLDGHGASFRSWVTASYCESTIKVRDAKKVFEDEKYRFCNVKENWNKELKEIRHSNIFKKTLYKLAKKYLFPSINESLAFDIDFAEKYINTLGAAVNLIEDEYFSLEERCKYADLLNKHLFIFGENFEIDQTLEDGERMIQIKEKAQKQIDKYKAELIKYYGVLYEKN